MKINGIFKQAPIDKAEIEIILAGLLGKDRSFVKAFPELILSNKNKHIFNKLLKRRIKYEPLAYILGYKEFCGLRFKIDNRAMVPRPETEELVAEVIKHVYALPNRERLNHWKNNQLTIVDVGTGCGNIAISLAKAIPFAKIYAVEEDLRAFRLAKENITQHNVEGQVTLLHGNLLEPIRLPVDSIVTNLPYIPTKRIDTLQPEIRNWEPRKALDGGSDGLELYRKLFQDAPRVLRPTGTLFYEFDGETFIKKF